MYDIFKKWQNIREDLRGEVVNTVPVIKSYPVEAAQLTFINDKFSKKFLDLLDNCVIRREVDNFVIHTENQTLIINEGDYLIRTRISRFLVCTEKIFREEYETTMINTYNPLF